MDPTKNKNVEQAIKLGVEEEPNDFSWWCNGAVHDRQKIMIDVDQNFYNVHIKHYPTMG